MDGEDRDETLIEGGVEPWSLVRQAFALFGLAFAAIVGAFASNLESLLLAAELAIMAGAVLASRWLGRSMALHLVSGSFIVYQTVVLDLTRHTPNLGVVWFLLVPSWTILWGRTRHVLLWGPATALAIGWTAYRADPADPVWQHPLTLPNLLAVLGLSVVFVVGFQRERRRRERELAAVNRRVLDETSVRRSAELKMESAEFARHRLLAMLSHELRSPMTSLALSADLLAEDGAPTPGSPLGRLQQCAQATLRTLDDILDLVRLEDGVVPPRREVFSLSGLLDDVARLMGPQAARSNVALVVDVASHTPDAWRGDRARLRQVLVNLVGNALKHTPRGQVSIRARRAETGLRFDVEDTGIGIAKDVIDHVFEPWRQGRSTDEMRGGVGLGLSISRDFVEAMNGRIWVDQSGPEGTRLCFVIDAEEAPADPAERSAQAPGKVSLRGRSLLIVDDDDAVREVVGRVFERAGARVESARDGEEAQRRLLARAFDLVVLDLEMPGRTGLEVLEAGENLPPVVVLSGSLEARAAAERAGAVAFVVKPVRARALLEIAAEVLSIRMDHAS